MTAPQTDERDPALVAADRRAARALAAFIALQIVIMIAARLGGFWR